MRQNKIIILDYVNVIIERRKLIISIFLIMFTTLFFFSLLLEDMYEADVVLVVEKTPLRLPFKEGSILFTEHVPRLNMQKHLTRLRTKDLAVIVAESIPDSLEKDLINATNLNKIEILKSKFKHKIGEENYEKMKKILGRSNESDDSLNSSHVARIIREMMGFQVTDEGVIKIKVSSANAEIVAPLANNFSEIFIRDNIAMNRYDVAKTRMFIEKQRETSLMDLKDVENRLMKFKNRMGIKSIKNIEEARILVPELSNLENELKIRRNIYNLLLQKEIDAKIREEEVSSNIRIVDKAVKPVHPVSSKRNKIRIMGFALGLALGIGLAFFLEFLNDSIRNAHEIKELYDLDVIAEIPNLGE